jgi:NTP pyrophosphatase (non-canonical NTP hydrolase)
MDLRAIEEKIRKISDRSSFDYKLTTPREKEILTKTVKLNEEVGELCNDILGILRLQRKSKLERFDRRNIYQEFADVLITLLQLAIASNVDLNRAVEDKLKAISIRLEKEADKT